jgi:hypothetical protein
MGGDPTLRRKNALFYKTQNGAHVGDLFNVCSFFAIAGGRPSKS